MHHVVLGRTGIQTTYLGIGTSAAYDGVLCPAKLNVKDYPPLLEHAYQLGVRLWDTSHTYGTHEAVREALRTVPRSGVVICSKTTAVGGRGARRDVELALRQIHTDYIDVFMLQCLRSRFDYHYRRRALRALAEAKKRGLIRAVGVACHGIGALEACRDSDLVDVVLARVNLSGHMMDSRQDDWRSVVAGMPTVKKLVSTALPRDLYQRLAGTVQKPIVTADERQTALSLMGEIHRTGKAVLGMKILDEGALDKYVDAALSFAVSQPFLSAIVLGCCTPTEVTEVAETVGALLDGSRNARSEQ